MMKKLLLADDSITIQKVVGIILSTEEYQLEITDDGDRAFTKALEEIPDLVIADISMPGRDGFELCRAIKSEPSLAGTSVLLLPGVFDHFDEAKADEVCADGWLTKPFESQALLDKVARLLDAETVRLPGMADSEEDEPTVEEQAKAEQIEVAENNVDTAVSEETLGLDTVDALASPADKGEEESPDDIWDAVSFAEEDLPKQAEPIKEKSVDEVSFVAEVIDPSVRDEVVGEAAPDEPVISTLEAENNPIVEETSTFKDAENLRSATFVDNDLGEVEEVKLNEQDEILSEDFSAVPFEELEPVDSSVLSEAEDEDLLELVDELEETPVSGTEESSSSAVVGEEALELMADDLVEQNTGAELDEVDTSSFAVVEDTEEAILELQEEESLDEFPPLREDINDTEAVDSVSAVTDNDLSAADEIIDLTEAEIVAAESVKEPVADAVIGGVETVVAAEPELDLPDEITEPAEEIELVEEEVEPAEEETFYFDEATEGDDLSVATGATSVSLDTVADEVSVTEQVEQQLHRLSEDELKEVIARVAGPMIEKMAGEMLEKIAWEVVPDLAEAMISEEIRKIKEGD